jgi:transcriptional regulator with XRE-family HTH domain
VRESVIKSLLDEQGVKYSHFAKKMGLPHAVAFSRIEAGEQTPPEGYYERAALFLRVDVSRVLPKEPAEVSA